MLSCVLLLDGAVVHGKLPSFSEANILNFGELSEQSYLDTK